MRFGSKPKPIDLAHLEAVRVEPGDIVVIRHPSVFTVHQVDRIVEAARRCFPANRILLMEQGASIDIYRKAAPSDPGATLRPNPMLEL